MAVPSINATGQFPRVKIGKCCDDSLRGLWSRDEHIRADSGRETEQACQQVSDGIDSGEHQRMQRRSEMMRPFLREISCQRLSNAIATHRAIIKRKTNPGNPSAATGPKGHFPRGLQRLKEFIRLKECSNAKSVQ